MFLMMSFVAFFTSIFASRLIICAPVGLANKLQSVVQENKKRSWRNWKALKSEYTKLSWKECQAVLPVYLMYGPLIKI